MRRHWWILFAYLVLSLVLTWPLAPHIATHVPGDGIDDPSLAWNLWWVKHALVDQPQNPFACEWQFWPIGVNLAFYTLTVLNGMLGLPITAAGSVILSYNVLLLFSFALSGYGGFLLARELMPRRLKRGLWPPTVGGALFAFASAKLFYAALGQGNIASSQWIPFALLYFIRAARPTGRWRDGALAGVFIVLQAYSEQTFASFLVLFAALAAIWGVAPVWLAPVEGNRVGTSGASQRTLRRRLVLRLLGHFSLSAAIFIVGIAPFLANMLPDMLREGNFFASGGGFSDLFSADLAGYALPTQLHPVLGGLIRSLSEQAGGSFPVNKGQQISIGYVASALALAGLWLQRRWRVGWLLAASCALFFLMTLGPSLRIAGHETGIPLPFAAVARLPFFEGNRYPSRYSVMLLISLAPVVACGVAALQERARRFGGRIAVAALVLILFENLSIPLPLFDLRVPAIYQQVAAEPGDFALLEMPLGWRNGARVAGKQDIIIMQELWYQTVHGKRLLGGNTSRNPEYKFQYFSESPTLARLIALTNAADVPQHDDLRAALAEMPITSGDRAVASEWASALSIRYVMVHRGLIPAEVEAALGDLFPLTLIAEEGDRALYRLDLEPTPIDRLYVSNDRGRWALGEGWSPAALDLDAVGLDAVDLDADGVEPVYAQRTEVRLLLPVSTEDAAIRLHAWSLASPQSVSLELDGVVLQSQPLATQPGWLTFALPTRRSGAPLEDVLLRFSNLAPISAIGAGPFSVGQTQALVRVPVFVRSAGQETGDFAHIFVHGVDVSPNSRGYNLVALNGETGAVVAAEAFDTFADPSAGARMLDWVRALPAGAVVAGGVKDEASMKLDEAGLTALQAIGVESDLRGHFRWGHAFIGSVGADPGTAQESIGAIRPVETWAGPRVTSSVVAAALDRVEIVR